MLFYPYKVIQATPDNWGLSYENIQLKLNENTDITGWYVSHPEAEKTILFFHGNGGNISHRGDTVLLLHKLKLNTLIIDYPGYGTSKGKPTEENLYQSAQVAWDYLVTVKKIKPNNIVIFGRSLGGAVAVDLASKVNAGGLILESTFSSVRDIVNIIFPLLSKTVYLRFSFDSLQKIDKVNYPVLVIHSPDDSVIPYKLGKKLFNKIKVKKTFLQISGDHNEGFMLNILYYMKNVDKFIKSL